MDTPTLTDELKAAIDKMNRTTQDQIEGRKFLDEFLADPTAKKALLRGYAGTGKTWLIGDWLEAVLSVEGCLENVCIAAPTHKALDVLRQKCAHLPVVFKTLLARGEADPLDVINVTLRCEKTNAINANIKRDPDRCMPV